MINRLAAHGLTAISAQIAKRMTLTIFMARLQLFQHKPFQALDNVVGLLKCEMLSQSGWDGDGEEAGGVGGGEATRGVLKRGAVFGRDAEALGSKQVNVGSRLGMLYFVGGGNDAEAGRQTRDAENTVHPGAVGVRGDGAGDIGFVECIEQGQNAGHWR